MLGQRILIFCYFTAVIVSLMIPRCWMAAHYCGNGHLRSVDISYELGQEEKLLPKVDAPSTPADGIRCRWEAEAMKLDGTALVVVTAFNVSKLNSRRVMRRSIRADEVTAPSSSSMYYQQLGPKAACSGHTAVDPERVAFETFHVLQLSKGAYLSVTYDSSSPVPDAELPPGLMMQVVEAGFCSRKMVSFQHSCYLMSPRRLSLRAELARLNGDSKILQLASFDSLDSIRQFVEANKQTAVFVGGSMRSKVPLDLTEPVRIGLFYSRVDKTIKFINCSGGQCVLQEVMDPEIIDTTLETDSAFACGSLRIDKITGREVLEFRDCSEQLPALISFADTPRTDCSNCSEPVLNWLDGLAVTDDATTVVVGLLKSKSFGVMIILAVVIATVCIAATVAVAILRHRYIRKRASSKEFAQTDYEFVDPDKLSAVSDQLINFGGSSPLHCSAEI